MSHPFAGGLISALTSEAMSVGYVTLLVETDSTADGDRAATIELSRRQVDGIVYATGGLVELIVAEKMRQHPMVLANCFDSLGLMSAFIPDDQEGAFLATTHLLKLGHRHIALLRGTIDDPATSRREQGFRRAMLAAGLDSGAHQVIEAGWNIDEGYRAAHNLLGSDRPPTAIVCSNDRTATGVLLFAASAGISVPRDLSVIGFDNQPFVAEHLVPALMTITLPHAAIGAAPARRLIQEIADTRQTKPAETLIPCQLITRESTAPVSR